MSSDKNSAHHVEDSSNDGQMSSPTRSTSNKLDAEFGGSEARAKLEKKLLRKLDARMSILVIIYILNYIDRNNAAYVDYQFALGRSPLTLYML